MNKFVDEKLLPSLWAKYQRRDKRYCEIIISDNQAHYLASEMHQVHTMGMHASRVIGLECQWQGRSVMLRKRGQYYFVAFGTTQDEDDANAIMAEDERMAKELEMAKKCKARGNPGRISKKLEDAKKRLESYIIYSDDEAEEKGYKVKMQKHYKQIIDILGK